MCVSGVTDFGPAKQQDLDSRFSHGVEPGAGNGCRPKAGDLNASQRADTGRPAIELGRLTKRSEFLRLRGGPSWKSASFVLVSRPQDRPCDGPGASARFGFTVTKRIGNAVKRNRARRRLREAVRLTAPDHAKPGLDYVVIARTGALNRAFTAILMELEVAFDRLDRQDRSKRSRKINH